jgi:hypothetical protein
MGWACGTYGGGTEYIQGFGGEAEKRGHLGDLNVDGRILFKWMLKKWNCVDWIDQAEYRDRW